MTRNEMKKLLLQRAVDIYDEYFVGGNDKSITIEKYDEKNQDGFKTIYSLKDRDKSVDKILDYDIEGTGKTVFKYLSDKKYDDYIAMVFDDDEFEKLASTW